ERNDTGEAHQIERAMLGRGDLGHVIGDGTRMYLVVGVVGVAHREERQAGVVAEEAGVAVGRPRRTRSLGRGAERRRQRGYRRLEESLVPVAGADRRVGEEEIGRASCRERGWKVGSW